MKRFFIPGIIALVSMGAVKGSSLGVSAHAGEEDDALRLRQVHRLLTSWRAANFGLAPERLFRNYVEASNQAALPQAPVTVQADCSFADLPLGAGSLSESVFSTRFCYQNVPASADAVFAPGHDVPAEFVNLWTAPRILDALQAFARNVASPLPVDAGVYFMMNQRAVDLWEQMVASEGSAEGARDAYFRAQFRGANAAMIRAEMTALHQLVVDFLRTTGFADTLFAGREATFGEPALPFLRSRLETHPLLMQIFDEIIAAWFPTEPRKGKLRDWVSDNLAHAPAQRASENIMRLMPLLPLSGAAPMGLWPTVQRTINYYYVQKSEKFISAREVFLSPLRNAARRNHTIFHWIHPFGWLAAGAGLIHYSSVDQESIEPELAADRATQVITPEAIYLAPAAYHAPNALAFIEAYRGLADRYGVTRETLLRK